MMSSDILSSRFSQELLLYLKYILKLIFKGFFLINRCLIFKVRRTRFVSAWILYHTAPQLSTLFLPFFMRFFQLLRVFCIRMDFNEISERCYGDYGLVFWYVICFKIYLFLYLRNIYINSLMANHVAYCGWTMWASSATKWKQFVETALAAVRDLWLFKNRINPQPYGQRFASLVRVRVAGGNLWA